MEFTKENIKILFNNCVISEIDMINGEPNSGIQYTKVECVKSTHFMDNEKISNNIENITGIYNQLPYFFHRNAGVAIDQFKNVAIRYDGQLWGDVKHIDYLIALLIASDLMVFKYEKSEWNSLPRGSEYLMYDV